MFLLALLAVSTQIETNTDMWLQRSDVAELEKQVVQMSENVTTSSTSSSSKGKVEQQVSPPAAPSTVAAPLASQVDGASPLPPRPPAPADADMLAVPPPRPPVPMEYSASPVPPEAYLLGTPLLVSTVPASHYGTPRVGGGILVHRRHIIDVSSATSTRAIEA